MEHQSVCCSLVCVIIVLLSAYVKSTAFQSQASVMKDDRYKQGREQYEAMKLNTRMPRYSECWTKAVNDLEKGCMSLTDDLQHRMALAFSNCFFLKTGRTFYPCEEFQEVSECTKDMSSEAYNTFTNFFTHTQNMCFFLQAQAWQELTEDTVNRLTDSSAHVAEQLQDSTQLQSHILSKQNESIRNQELLIARGQELKSTIETSAYDVNKMVQEFKQTTTEQKALIFEVFDKVNSLQSIVMGEFTGFYSLIFYTVSIVVSYLITSTPRTSGARFWLFVIMTINIAAERCLVYIAPENEENSMDANSVLYRWMWYCRKVFTSAAVVTWVVIALRYEDLNRTNHKLLMDIKHELEKMKSTALPDRPVKQIKGGISPVMEKGQGDVDTLHPNGFLASSKPAYVDEASDSDSSFSSNDSGLSDNSFLPATHHSDTESSSDDDSFVTLSNHTSCETTPCIMDELRLLRETTPLRDMQAAAVINLSKATLTSPVKRGRGRPPGSRRSCTPPVQSPSPGSSHYNLRHKSQSPTVNPVVLSESPQQFSRNLKQLAALNRYITRQTAHNLRVTPDRSGRFFSSDED